MNGVPSFDFAYLVPPVVALVVVIFLAATGKLAQFSPLRTRVFVFSLGALLSVPWIALLNSNFTAFRWFDSLDGGLEWLLLYEIARPLMRRLARSRLLAFLVSYAVVSFVRVPIGSFIYFCYYTIAQGTNFDFDRFGPALVQWLSRSFQYSSTYPYYLFSLLDTFTLIVLIFCLRHGSSLISSTRKREFWQTGAFGGAGGADMEMPSLKSHTTRLLCSSAFLAGSSFRDMVLNFLDDPNRAAAPELGMDLPLVAKVCQFARNRDRRYTWLFLACTALALVAAFADPTIGAGVLVLSSAILYFRKKLQEDFQFVRFFKKDVFNPEAVARQFSGDLEPESSSTLPADDQNLIVYQGFSPFIGAGLNLGGWSFVVNADKGKEEHGVRLEPMKFEISELYDDIDRCIDVLELSGLTHHDTYFVNGSDIRDDQNILPDSHGHPVQKISPDRCTIYRNTNDRRIRHYQWIKVMDWGNELCTSYFFRCTLRGPNLFVEINRHLLTPLADNYRKIDAVGDRDWKHGLGLAILSCFVGPILAIASPFIIFGRMNEFLEELFDKKEKKRRKQVDENPLFNYGTGSSFRESVSSGQFIHYFQKLDSVFYSNVLEREILSSIVDFLDAHDIDTSELKERQSTILNSGIIVQGGDVKAESLAVGSGAQAVHVTKSETPRKPRIRRQVKEDVA